MKKYLQLMFCLSLARSAHADVALKRAIFEDCPKALEISQKLAASETTEAIDFLTEVLALPGPNVQPPRVDAGGGELWRIYNPDHELEVKDCALQIARSLHESNNALRLVPTISALIADQSLPAKLQESAIRVARELLEHSSTTSPEVAREVVESLISQQLSGPVEARISMLRSVTSLALPLIAARIEKAPTEDLENLFSLLKVLDLAHTDFNSAALKLSFTEDPLRVQIALKLLSERAVESELICIRLAQLGVNLNQQIKTEALTALRRLLGEGASAISETCSKEIMRLAAALSGQDLSELVTVFMRKQANDLSIRKLQLNIAPKNDELYLEILLNLTSLNKSERSKLLALARSTNLKTQKQALRVMSLRPEFSAELKGILLSLLKTPQQSAERMQELLEILKLIVVSTQDRKLVDELKRLQGSSDASVSKSAEQILSKNSLLELSRK
ncbi:hypothetical protein JNK13_10585 [bacterium]|nr:hypothetical protein [bacterium]